MSTHTPGPWTVYSEAKEYALTKFLGIDGADGNAVVLFDKHGGIESEDDARLIAAAPEMLKALQRLTHPAADDEDLAYALEVIAKATGGAV